MARIQTRTKLINAGSPLPAEMLEREIVVNEVDQKIYFKKTDGTIIVLNPTSSGGNESIFELNVAYGRYAKLNILDDRVGINAKIQVIILPNNHNVEDPNVLVYALPNVGNYDIFLESNLRFGGLFLFKISKS
jgi:hypothetical protein